MTINIAAKMLTDAAAAVEARQSVYGPPNRNFACIAALWQAYLRGKYGELATLTIDEADVAAMSGLIKIARLAETPAHEDSWVDMAGYAACGRQVTAGVEDDEEKIDPVLPNINRDASVWWRKNVTGDEAQFGLAGLATAAKEPDPRLGDTVEMQTTGPLADSGYTYNWEGEGGYPADPLKLSRVIDGEHKALIAAFNWECAAQGGGHWGMRYYGRVPISNEDRLYLMWLRDEAIKRQAKSA